MIQKPKSIHEPNVPLADAEDAIADAERLNQWVARKRAAQPMVVVRIPFPALLEALDSLEPMELQQVARRVQERLATAS